MCQRFLEGVEIVIENYKMTFIKKRRKRNGMRFREIKKIKKF